MTSGGGGEKEGGVEAMEGEGGINHVYFHRARAWER